MITLYDAEYKFWDEPHEIHNTYIVTYTEDDAVGRFFAAHTQSTEEEDDMSALDTILIDAFGLVDDDICFYCDMTGRPDVAKALKEDHDLDLVRLEEIGNVK